MSPESLAHPAFGVAITLAVYGLASALHRRVEVGALRSLLHPVGVSIATLIALLVAAGIPYRSYAVGGDLLLVLLGPAVVALGVPLHERRADILSRKRALGAGILAGSLTGIATGAGIAHLLGADPIVVRSLAPKSVTTPIAIGLAETVGGIPELAAAVVVLTGCVGAVLGPGFARAIGIRDPVALGLAIGTAAHGIGTARILDEDRLAGAVAGLAIGLAGLATAGLLPVLDALF